MEKENFYIYKITNENDIVLYVGQTKNIDSRIKNHLSNRHWIQEGYKIYIAIMNNKTDSDIYEIYYINKLNPFYNIANSNNKPFSIELSEIKFQLYKTVSNEDLLLRNNRFAERNDIDKNSITIGESYASKLLSRSDRTITDIMFKFIVFEEEPITLLKFKVDNKVNMAFYLTGGLHKFFYTKNEKNHFHNIKIYLFAISKLIDGDKEIDEDYTMVDLDILDLSNYELISKEEADVIRQNKINKESGIY